MSEANLYLVSYDIASPRRWRHLVKAVKTIGERVQLSVFLCRATPLHMARLEKNLVSIIDKKEDRLLVINLGSVAVAQNRIQAQNFIWNIANLEALIV